MEYEANLPTPTQCIADFSVVPIGTQNVSFAKEVSQVARMAKMSGLKTSTNQLGTAVEGPWNRVMEVVGQAHTMLHRQGIFRIQTDIRVITRTDREQSMDEPVERVEGLLHTDG